VTVKDQVASLLLSRPGRWLTPTEIGLALGYSKRSAVGAVGVAIKQLIADGSVTRRKGDGPRWAEYRWTGLGKEQTE